MGKKGIKKKVTDLQISRALITHEGRIGTVAKELGITTQTVYKRMKQNPRIKARFDDADEELIDLALKGLKSKLEDENFKAIQYVLDNRGKNRGYGSKQKELEMAEDNQGMTLNILDTSDMDIATKKLLMESLQKQKAKQLEEGKTEE